MKPQNPKRSAIYKHLFNGIEASGCPIDLQNIIYSKLERVSIITERLMAAFLFEVSGCYIDLTEASYFHLHTSNVVV